MKSKFFIFLFAFSFISGSFGQDVVEANLLGDRSIFELSIQNADLLAAYRIFVKNGVNYYKVRYTSVDAKGAKDTLSGLMVVPKVTNGILPRLVYMHGTANCKDCVPSRLVAPVGSKEGDIALFMGGQGFFTLLPDYVGMGDGRGFQTYVHNKTIVSAGRDMVTACEKWAQSNGVKLNNQMFISGYSQGGYGSMALHKSYEENPNPLFEVTAAAHLSGPYSLSGVMRDVILSDKEYATPAYVPNTILGFNEVDKSLFNNISEIFKDPYVDAINSYRTGDFSLSKLNEELIKLLKANEGLSIGKKLMKDEIVQQIITNPSYPLNIALRNNDVYRWAPKAATRIYYCKADEQVPFQNAIVARDTMTFLGAKDLIVQDLDSTEDHGGCVAPAFVTAFKFFLEKQGIKTTTEGFNLFSNKILVSPSPTKSVTVIEGDLKDFNLLLVFDQVGRVINKFQLKSENRIELDLSSYNPGLYYISLMSNDGKMISKKIYKQ